MVDDQSESLLKFPGEFIIKTFGHASDEYEIAVMAIIRKHVSDLRENCLRARPSKDGKYLALTITLTVTSREQLDSIYRDLSTHPLILMAL